MTADVMRPTPRWAYEVFESNSSERGRIYGDIRGAAEALLKEEPSLVEKVVEAADPFDALLRAIGEDPDEQFEFRVREVPLRQCIRLVA